LPQNRLFGIGGVIAAHHRRDQGGNVGGIELPVGVETDDQIGAVIEAVAQGGVKRAADAADRRMADDARAGAFGLGGGAILAAVVDDQNLDGADAGDGARHAADYLADGPLLVQSRDCHQQMQSRRFTHHSSAARGDAGCCPLRIHSSYSSSRRV
jgi:hypothetical protein